MLKLDIGDSANSDNVYLYINFDGQFIVLNVNGTLTIVSVEDNGDFEIKINTKTIPGNLLFNVDWYGRRLFNEHPEGVFNEIDLQDCERIPKCMIS